MAIKISEWVDGNVLEAVDLNDSFGAVARGTAEQANKILKAAGSYENGGVTAADNFTTPVGVNGTVSFTDISGTSTQTDSGSWTDVANGYDDNLNTFSRRNGGTNTFFGFTFASTFVNSIDYKFTVADGSGATATGFLQTFDGTTWNTIATLGSATNTNTIVTDSTVINDTIEGIRLFFTSSDGNGLYDVYNINVNTGVTAIFDTDKYISNSTVSNQATDNNGTLNNSVTLNLDGGVKFTMNSTKNLISVDKDTSATVTRCLLKDSAGTVISTATFSGNTATFDDIPVLTNATEYRLECDNNGANATYRRNTSPSFPVSGTNLNFTGGSVNGADNSTNYNIASVNTGDVSYNNSAIACSTNTITLDSNVKAVQVYTDSEIPTGTSITVDIGDGTTTLVSDAAVDSNGFTRLQDLSSAVAGQLALTFNLNIINTNVTPKISAYGVNLIR